jgi:hypothetical protein
MNTINTMMIWPVQKPCQIAYRDPLTGVLWLRPYIDLHLKSKIWGICINGAVFKLTHEPDAKWDTATNYTDEKSKAKMPQTTDLDAVFPYVADFNRVVGELNKHRIPAESWRQGFYWSGENDGDNAVVMDMGSGKVELLPKRIPNVYTRLVSYRIINKPINTGATLAYWRNGRIEVSLDLHLDCLHQLWGIQTCNKNIFCKLTDEPQMYDWNAGMQLAKEQSTDTVKLILPSAENMLEVEKYYQSNNDTLAIIAAYGIKVDLFDKRKWGYLTSTEYGEGHFITHYHEMIAKNKPCKCRLFAQPRKNPVVF